MLVAIESGILQRLIELLTLYGLDASDPEVSQILRDIGSAIWITSQTEMIPVSGFHPVAPADEMDLFFGDNIALGDDGDAEVDLADEEAKALYDRLQQMYSDAMAEQNTPAPPVDVQVTSTTASKPTKKATSAAERRKKAAAAAKKKEQAAAKRARQSAKKASALAKKAEKKAAKKPTKKTKSTVVESEPVAINLPEEPISVTIDVKGPQHPSKKKPIGTYDSVSEYKAAKAKRMEDDRFEYSISKNMPSPKQEDFETKGEYYKAALAHRGKVEAAVKKAREEMEDNDTNVAELEE